MASRCILEDRQLLFRVVIGGPGKFGFDAHLVGGSQEARLGILPVGKSNVVSNKNIAFRSGVIWLLARCPERYRQPAHKQEFEEIGRAHNSLLLLRRFRWLLSFRPEIALSVRLGTSLPLKQPESSARGIAACTCGGQLKNLGIFAELGSKPL